METQLIHSTRLDKLEDLVEDVRLHSEAKFYEDEHSERQYSAAAAIVALIKLQSLSDSLIKELVSDYSFREQA